MCESIIPFVVIFFIGVVIFIIGYFREDKLMIVGIVGMIVSLLLVGVFSGSVSEYVEKNETYMIEEIFEMEDEYVCVSKEKTIMLVPKSVVVFNESERSEIMIEKKGEKITKAIFFITKEQMSELLEMK